MSSSNRKKQNSDKAAKRLCALWESLYGWQLWAKAQKTVLNYIELIGMEEVEESVYFSTSLGRDKVDQYRYFCGICRTKLSMKLEGTSCELGPWPLDAKANIVPMKKIR
jgi:hypothetical protein